jgi:hypothetical protein
MRCPLAEHQRSGSGDPDWGDALEELGAAIKNQVLGASAARVAQVGQPWSLLFRQTSRRTHGGRRLCRGSMRYFGNLIVSTFAPTNRRNRPSKKLFVGNLRWSGDGSCLKHRGRNIRSSAQPIVRGAKPEFFDGAERPRAAPDVGFHPLPRGVSRWTIDSRLPPAVAREGINDSCPTSTCEPDPRVAARTRLYLVEV